VFREIRELVRYHAGSTEQFAEHDVRDVYGKTMRQLEESGFDGVQGKDVLDLGCGQRFPFALLCAAHGARATALDIDYVKPDPLPVAFVRTARHGGLKRAMKSAVRGVLWDGTYFRALGRYAGVPLMGHRRSITFVVADPAAASYDLPDESFDLIASNAVLEHVGDVPKFASEVRRLLKPGGYFYALIHNFYSLSGGHHMEWAFPDRSASDTVPPWDHLRENRFPAWVYLNRMKPQEYRAAFERRLDVVRFEGAGVSHDPGELEGERHLTDEVAAELSEYPRELLLTRAWVMIVRKDARR